MASQKLRQLINGRGEREIVECSCRPHELVDEAALALMSPLVSAPLGQALSHV